MKHEFRNKDKFQVLGFREWFRNNYPSGKDGYVVEDLDLVNRIYGPNFLSDSKGKFMLCEVKFFPAYIELAQRRTFGLIHDLLRIADPERKRYAGFFVVQYTHEDWDLSEFYINRVSLSRDEHYRFFLFDIGDDIPEFPPK